MTLLRTLTLKEFGKRRTRDTFKENIELAVNGSPESRVLIPLVERLISDDSVLNILILAYFMLSKTIYARLSSHKLTEAFTDFLTRIVRICTIFSSIREKFIKDIKDICQRNNNETSNKLLGLSLLCLYLYIRD